MDLESISKAYFSNLNALAEKISADIQSTQEAYQDLWHTLNKKEQNQAIDESIINPSAVLKYANSPMQPLKQNYNAYSWFCKSQLNIDRYDQVDSMFYDNSRTKGFCRSDADQSSKLTSTVKEEEQCNLSDNTSSKQKVANNSSKSTDDKTLSKSQKSSVLKPKNPPPPPPVVAAQVAEQDISADEYETKSNDIPKTGFDFLDNW